MRKDMYMKHLQEKGYKIFSSDNIVLNGIRFKLHDAGCEKEVSKGVIIGRYCLILY